MSVFKFKRFDLQQADGIQKVGTDAMLLGALTEFNNPKHILDIGAGTGVLSLMMAQKFPLASVFALDISEKAIELIKRNIETAPFATHFTTIKEDFLHYNPDKTFDLVISNPPFFSTQMPSFDEERTLQRHEGNMTLQNLINHAASMLSEKGELWMILPMNRTSELLSKTLALSLVQQHRILGKPNRPIRDILVFSKEKNSEVMPVNMLTIRNDDGSYSARYKALTKEFHFNSL